MPTFFFYINEELVDPDDGGQSFVDDEAAKVSAVRAFGEMLRDEGVALLEGGSFRLLLKDEAGATVLELEARAKN